MKIAFLILTTISSVVFHKGLWQDFFKGNYKQASIYIHSKVPTHSSPFKHYHCIPSVPTTWANTMDAQIELLKAALQDTKNYKFVFISESTIPLQSFNDIYKALTQDNKSMFDYSHNYHYDRNLRPIPFNEQYKNAQWVILNRKHAELMIQDCTYKKIITGYLHDQEHYPSTFLAHMDLLSEVKKVNATFTLWESGYPNPHTFYNLTSDRSRISLIKSIKNKEFLFARKFAASCDLTPLIPYLPFFNASYRHYRR